MIYSFELNYPAVGEEPVAVKLHEDLILNSKKQQVLLKTGTEILISQTRHFAVIQCNGETFFA